jgi:hypothetical protein
MLKYLTKFALDVLPSVVATILGAYIVNHYINAKSDADAPPAAMASVADPKIQKNDPKSADVAKIPEPGVKAKGISERAMIEKSASEGVAEVKSVDIKPADIKPVDIKPADTKPLETKPVESKAAEVRPAESVSAPAEPRRAAPAREKAVAKATPTPVTPAPVTAPVAEANSTPEERRDANDLARAAIERLRGSAANSQEATRQGQEARGQEAKGEANRQPERTIGVAPVPIRPLPPPIAVAAPPADGNNAGSPPYTASVRNGDPNRPTPPAEIPSLPLDLRAAANEPATAKERAKAVAEDVLSAAKSMFHTVVPQ